MIWQFCSRYEDGPMYPFYARDTTVPKSSMRSQGTTWRSVKKFEQTSARGRSFWLNCIRQWYPDLEKKTYFLPPFHFRCVSFTNEQIAGNRILVVPSANALPQTADSDERGACVQELVLRCLRAIAEDCGPEEAMMVISQLQFGKYLNKPTYAAAASLLPSLRLRQYRNGDFDVLIIHRQCGLIIGEIKSVGANFGELGTTEPQKDAIVKKVVEKAIKQLNKAGFVLKTLVSDVGPLNITKILMMPNVGSSQLLHVLTDNNLQQRLRQCLGVQNQATPVVQKCLCRDQVEDLTAPDGTQHAKSESLSKWWRKLLSVANSQTKLTFELYEDLVARFCGPATTVEIQCISPPRLHLELRTEGEGVSEIGKRMVRFVLYPEQISLLNQAPLHAFIVGPPGTGKTVVLVLHGLNCLQRGCDVYVVSVWSKSKAASFLIESQIQNTMATWTAEHAPSRGAKLTRLEYDFANSNAEFKGAIETLTRAGQTGGQMCILADEVGPEYGKRQQSGFPSFCELLLTARPQWWLWAAAIHKDIRPQCLPEFTMTQPLRSPPVVVREVKESPEIRKMNHVYPYSGAATYAEADGPPVKRITHYRGQESHGECLPDECEQCGRDAAKILKDLDINGSGISITTPPLEYRDVIALFDNLRDERKDESGNIIQKAMGFVRGLRECDVPVIVVGIQADTAAIREIALAQSNVLIVTHIDNVRGLERKIVMTGNDVTPHAGLHGASRCSSQLVLIDCRD